MISLNPIIDCESDSSLLNYLLKVVLVSTSVARRLSEQYLMYHASMRSCKSLTKCSFFILLSVIYCTIHTMFATNQNCSKSSLPMPLKVSIFIVFSMLNGGGKGGGVGEGVCNGGWGGDGLKGWFVLGIPLVIIWTMLRGIVFPTPSSSLEGVPIKGL